MKKLAVIIAALMMGGCTSIGRSMVELAASNMSDASLCYNMGSALRDGNIEAAKILRLEIIKREINDNMCFEFAKDGMK